MILGCIGDCIHSILHYQGLRMNTSLLYVSEYVQKAMQF